jgi:hypothetical protein
MVGEVTFICIGVSDVYPNPKPDYVILFGWSLAIHSLVIVAQALI